MTSIPAGLSIAGAAALGLLQDIFIRSRFIGPFVANVTLTEEHTDQLRITDHPVERNATISDHAYKLPARVTIQVGYSNSNLAALGNPNYVQDIYEQFLALQESRQLIQILTGKRLYDNMLIERLSVTTKDDSENALMMTCECREIIIVATQTVTSAPASDQSAPQATAPVQDQGAVSTQNANNLNQPVADSSLAAEEVTLANDDITLAPAVEIPLALLPDQTTLSTQGMFIPGGM